MVGCVLVARGRIIAEGYHHCFGGPHAEVDALRHCRTSPRGATAYVTLEPCCFTGKTPPCTDALIAAGIGRVVAAVNDPNPRVAGHGVRKLRAAGLRVDVGLLEEDAARLNAPYLKLLQQRRPWVILKWAQSIDGKIATRTGDSKWISDERARAHAHRVRGCMDAIIIGSHTARIDNPQLTARSRRPRRVATRVVLDTQLRTPSRARLVQTARTIPTWFICGASAPKARANLLQDAGCVLHRVPATRDGLSLAAVLDLLGATDMTNVLVEGGGRLLGRFVDQRLADEVHVYVAPLLLGGAEAVSALSGSGPGRVCQALTPYHAPEFKKLGGGWYFRAIVGPQP